MASPNRTCSLDDCALPHYGRGWCNIHYKRWTRHRSFERLPPGKPAVPPAERFWAKVHKTESCWLWTAGVNRKGYGQFSGGTTQIAHRFAYEMIRGPIPDGLQIDHLCRIRHCVNPDHMEPVTSLVNVMRGVSLWAINARKTQCDHGHPFDEKNTIWIRGGKARDCRTCRRRRNQR